MYNREGEHDQCSIQHMVICFDSVASTMCDSAKTALPWHAKNVNRSIASTMCEISKTVNMHDPVLPPPTVRVQGVCTVAKTVSLP